MHNHVKKVSALFENAGNHEYCCAMLYFDFPQIQELHQRIDPSDVYEESGDSSYGLEKEPHVTLLYGLHSEVDPRLVEKEVCSESYSQCKAHTASLFENEKYDVLKFDISGQGLHEANAKLKKFPFTSNYPDYHPHMTVAYLKVGTGKKYVDLFNDLEFDLNPTHAVYSMTDGTRHEFNIDSRVDEEIVKVGDKWNVYPRKPKAGMKKRKALGSHSTKKKAIAQLQAIEISKHKNESQVLTFSQFISENLGLLKK